MERYAFPIRGEFRVNRIQREDVLRVLTPIWARKPETARRVRQRIRSVLRWTHAYGYVQENMTGEAAEGTLPSLTTSQAHFSGLSPTPGSRGRWMPSESPLRASIPSLLRVPGADRGALGGGSQRYVGRAGY